MNWIKVEDSLPPDCKAVLAFIGQDGGSKIRTAYYDALQKEWWYLDYPIPVTHWMPLPNPPEGE